METLCPTSLVPNSNWIIHHGLSTPWTKEENKKFERALAVIDDKTPNRWFHVAAMIPGKSVYDVMNQYRVLVEDVTDIDAGLVPVPGYMSSPFTLELADDNRRFDAFRKKGSNRTMTMTTTTTTHYSDQDRKKGVPWTEEEHRRFLLGLQKHGKGDWRNISRNFVITKTPTQVASHAQKYYLRQVAGGKDKRRPSIHDITTVDLTNNNNNNNAKEAGAHNNNNINNKPNELISSARVKTLSDSWNLHHNVTMSDGGANMMVFDSPHPNAIASRYIVNF